MAAPVETAEERRKRQMDGVPDLPPLLAQILAETRAKQLRAKERAEQGLPPEEDEEKKQAKGKPGGPLLLEAPPSAHLVIATHDAPIPKELSDSEDSDAEGEADAPPGPPDPERCKAHGPGFSGAAAGQPVKLTITARDAAGKRVREGGAHILVMVEPVAPPGTAEGEEPEAIQAQVEDHGNGTYTAVYTVPSKGNYQLHIEVNGEPLGNSPFPIFFSAPVAPPPGAPPPPVAPGDAAAVAAAEAAGLAAALPTVTAGGIQVVTADAIKAATQQATAAAGVAVAGALAGAEAAALGMPTAYAGAYQNSLGVQMAQLGMKFPPTLTEEQGNRMVVVSGVPAIATVEALKSVFGFCGTIRTCTLAGANSGFAFLEFSAAHEAAAALAMSGAALMGQTLRLELATEAKRAADAMAIQAQAANPYVALQLQQVQQFQLLQQQQMALAEQVASMRAQQRTGVVLPPPAPKPLDNDSQKSAALAAAIALSKKLAGGGGAAPAAAAEAAANGEKRRSRSRSRSRSKSRDRSRRERQRSRSRDGRRDRRDGSRDRRSRRSRSRDRRSRHDGSRDKRSRRSRSRSREHKHKHRHSHRDKKERRRSRSRDRRRSDKGEKEKGAAGAGGGEQQPTKQAMDWEAGGSAPAAAKPKEQDELEALLDELDD